MFLNYKTQGFVLRKENSGEADQSLLFYTRDFGKIRVLAKASRRPDSKLKNAVQVFYLSEIEFVQGRNQKTLTDAILIDKFVDIRKSLLKVRLAFSFTKIFCALVSGQERDNNLWQLLRRFFFELNSESLTRIRSLFFYHFFFWRFLSILGYSLELESCLSCRKKVGSPPFFLMVKEGGLVCGNCRGRLKLEAEKVDPQVIKFLKEVSINDWKRLGLVDYNSRMISDLRTLGRKYFIHIYDKK